jgi:hypothetical protein
LVRRCQKLHPSVGVIICQKRVFEETEASFRAAGLKLLHNVPLRFPIGNYRDEFIGGMAQALKGHLAVSS